MTRLVTHAKQHAFDEVVPDGLATFLNGHRMPNEPTYAVGIVKEQLLYPPDATSTVDPLTSVDTALQGAALVRDVARRLRNANADTREKLARDLEGLAFGLQFLFDDLKATNYRDAVEKARKWDKLIALLPSIHDLVEWKEAQDVRIQGGSDD